MHTLVFSILLNLLDWFDTVVRLPEQSATTGAEDDEVAGIVARMLEDGVATHIPSVDVDSVIWALDGCDLDVVYGGISGFNYMHKVVEGNDVYLFGNLRNRAVSRTVSLRGNFRNLYALDPRTGSVDTVETTVRGGRTLFELSLDPSHCRIILSGGLKFSDR